MATIKRFEDLEIWQEARKLCQDIIRIANDTELKNHFRLRDQIKASSGSVMDNIAEGFERDGNLEFRQFLSIAKGSAGNLQVCLPTLLEVVTRYDVELPILCKNEEINHIRAVCLQENINTVLKKLLKGWFS